MQSEIQDKSRKDKERFDILLKLFFDQNPINNDDRDKHLNDDIEKIHSVDRTISSFEVHHNCRYKSRD